MTKRFAIINAGMVDNIAIAEQPLDTTWIDLTSVSPEPGIGWLYENGVFAPPPAPPAPPPLPNIITKTAMISRLTTTEFVALLTDVKTDVIVEAWYTLFTAASQVNLDDPRTIGGFDLLVAKGIVTQSRATEILTAPVQPSERP